MGEEGSGRPRRTPHASIRHLPFARSTRQLSLAHDVASPTLLSLPLLRPPTQPFPLRLQPHPARPQPFPHSFARPLRPAGNGRVRKRVQRGRVRFRQLESSAALVKPDDDIDAWIWERVDRIRQCWISERQRNPHHSHLALPVLALADGRRRRVRGGAERVRAELRVRGNASAAAVQPIVAELALRPSSLRPEPAFPHSSQALSFREPPRQLLPAALSHHSLFC